MSRKHLGRKGGRRPLQIMVCAKLFSENHRLSGWDWNSGFHLGLFAPGDIWQYLVTFWVVATQGKGATSMYSAEALTIAKHLTIHRTVPHNKIII